MASKGNSVSALAAMFESQSQVELEKKPSAPKKLAMPAFLQDSASESVNQPAPIKKQPTPAPLKKPTPE